jgi:multidrug resistance protein, MATE family
MILEYSYKQILKVAIPMMISGFIQSIVMITDSAFISRYSTEAFDAVGNGGLAYITMYMCLLGMGDGSQIIIARRFGSDQASRIGRVFGTSVITNLLLAILLFVILYFAMPPQILAYSKNPTIASLQGQFIQIRSFALFFAFVTVSIQAFFLAKGKTWVVLISALITALSNVLLDYTLIFGKLGMPEMGLEGAALASTIADGMGMLFLLIFLLISEDARSLKLFRHFSFNLRSMKELLKVGSPLMLQGFLALATWTLFFTWLERKGQFDLTVSQNIRSIYFLAFVPIWGFAGTTKTYISQYLGAKRYDEIPKIQRRIQILTVGFLLISFHGAIFYPQTLIQLINPEEVYLEKSAEILQFIVGSILIFGFVSVYFQTIHGSGNTLHSMLIELTTVIIYSIASYFLIVSWEVDVFWIWTVEYIYFISLGALSIGYLKTFNWKNKKV